MKAACEKKLKLNEIEFENFKTIVAEAEACTAMVTKDECSKKQNDKNTKIELKR